MNKKLWVLTYVALAILTGLAYVTTRDYLISTPIGYITVSNLTLNYILFTFLLGGVAGWFAWTRMFKQWKSLYRTISTSLTTLLVAELWLVLAAFGGYTIKVQELLGPVLIITVVVWSGMVGMSGLMYRRKS